MKRRNKTKTILVLAMVALILAVAVGGTIAYLVDKTSSVTNTFTPARVTCAVEETFDGTTKSNVSIKNTGNTSAYIRAMVVANWVKDGAIVEPEEVELTLANGWVAGQGGYYYYYNAVVPAGGNTGILIDSYTPGASQVEGAHLEMNIICQAVQSEPAHVVTDVWGWTPTTSGSGN